MSSTRGSSTCSDVRSNQRPSDEARCLRNSRSSSVRSNGAFITTSGRPALACSASASAISYITGAGHRP
ncbi:hypothetical protein RKD44_006398 [Streptomyces collinus]